MDITLLFLFFSFYLFDVECDDKNDDKDEWEKWTEIEAKPSDCLSIDQMSCLTRNVEHRNRNCTKSKRRKLIHIIRY